MKRLVLSVVALLIACQVNAQNDAISKYFAKYQDDEKFTHVNISGKMFSMINNIEVEDDEDRALVESLGKIKGLKVLAADSKVDGKEMYQEAMQLIRGKGFEELMSVREEDKDIKFLISEKNNKVDELFMVMGGGDEFALVSIIGNGIDVNQLYKLSKSVGFNEFEHLEKVKEKKSGH